MAYWFTKEGKEINRATYEFWGDTDADILSIPKREYVPYSFGIALNEGDTTLWICDSNKVWYRAGSWGGGGGSSGGEGGSYDDTLILQMIADLQQKLNEAEGNIETVKEIVNNYEGILETLHNELTNKINLLGERVTALENREPGMGECDCVQHSILNGNWDGIMDEPSEPELPPITPEPEPEPTNWDMFVEYCKEHHDDADFIGTIVVDDEGEAKEEFRIVNYANITESSNDEVTAHYDLITLQVPYGIAESLPFNTIDDVHPRGWNDWEHSVIRQYLNSDKTNWWEPQYEGNVAPVNMPSKGYLAGLSDDLRAHLFAYDKDVIPSVTGITFNKNDLVTIPSIQEIGGTNDTYWHYYSGIKTLDVNAKRIYNLKNESDPAFIALANPNENNDYQRAYIKKTGAISYSNASNPTAITPVIYIKINDYMEDEQI